MNQIKDKVQTKVSAKIVFLIITIVIFAGGGLVISNLPATGGDEDDNPKLEDIGDIDVTWGGCESVGEREGERTTRASCKSKKNKNTGEILWLAFCPDSDGKQKSGCSCNDDTIEKSSRLTAAEGLRDGLVSGLNDGNISESDIKNSGEFRHATGLSCACVVFGSGNAPEDERTIVSAAGVHGVHSFVSKFAKMMSKMADNEECKVMPNGCRVSSSYRGDDDPKGDGKVPQEDWDNQSNISAHNVGRAADFACDVPATNSGQGCTGAAAELLGKIKGASAGLNIIEECDAHQRSCNGTSGTTQVIHVDEKSRGNNPDDNPCHYKDCSYTCDQV